jgi:hypothetical protein
MLCGEAYYTVRNLLHAGVLLNEFARRTGYDRKTIRKLRDQPTHPPPLQRRWSRLLDPHTAYLEQRVERGVLNATKLSAEIGLSSSGTVGQT